MKEYTNRAALIDTFEGVPDACVFGLYFEEEMKDLLIQPVIPVAVLYG